MLDFINNTALFFDAAARGDVAVLNELIDAGINVNIGNSVKETALHVAVKNHKPEAAVLLLRRGADANAMDNNGITPAFMASKNAVLVEIFLRCLIDAALKIAPSESLLNAFPIGDPPSFPISHESAPSSSSAGAIGDELSVHMKRLSVCEPESDKRIKKPRGW